MIQRQALGRIFSVHGSYVQDWLLYPSDYNWRVLSDEGGKLRAVADIGTHWLDLVTAITGLEVEAVCADLSTVHLVRERPQGEVETFTGKVLRIGKTEMPPCFDARQLPCRLCQVWRQQGGSVSQLLGDLGGNE